MIPSVFGEEKVVIGGEYSVAFGVFLFITGKMIGEYGERIKNTKFIGEFSSFCILYNTVVKVRFEKIDCLII